MYRWLADAVADQGVVVTASRRLARELRQAFDDQQIALGHSTWRTPCIRSWQDWLTDTVESSSTPSEQPLRIDLAASTVLWEQSLDKHNDGLILNFRNLVRLAMQSWQRIHDWRVPLRELQSSAQSKDQRLFADAAMSYQKSLLQNNWVDAAGLAAFVSNLLQSGKVNTPDRLTLAGFDRPTPAIETILAQMSANGCAVSRIPVPPLARQIQLVSYTDGEEELRAAGAWARAILEANADARLAVISSDLDQDAARTTRLVREGLAPGWQYATPEYRSAVGVSLGRSLSSYPVIAIALLLLRWAADGLATCEISILLRSRFFAGPVGGGRTMLELRLRRLPDRVWQPADLHFALSGPEQEPDATQWLNCVQTLENLHAARAQQRSPSEWAAGFDALMSETGWPGLDQPDSGEFQLINRWRELLNQLAACAIVQPQMSLGSAIRRLNAIAADAIYQPQTRRGLVHVYGALETTAMEFDAVWVCGMDAGHWPANTHPPALLARTLQRKYGMPDASPQDTLEFSRQVIHRLASSAPQVVLSWARTDGDSERLVSPLLDPFDTVQNSTFCDPDWHAQQFLAGDTLVDCEFDPVPPIGPEENVVGGAYTVQRQCAEPFSAFATGRLRIPHIEKIEPGLAARLRGSLIHHALHELYRECPSREAVLRWTSEEAETRIRLAVAGALTPHLRTADAVHRRLLEFERARIQALLRSFLTADLQRNDFSVASVEASIAFERHNVRLGLRLDRADRLPDGSILVIDYKTGASKSLLNRDGIPADLQLVVYASALGEDIGGLALINIDSRGIVFKAVGGSTCLEKADPDAWPQRLAEWQSLVDTALRQLAAGDVRINMQQGVQDGRSLALLSRIEEQRRAQ